MDVFYSVAQWLIYILGIVNLVLGSLIFFTCRCIPGWKLTSGLMQYQAYKRFFRAHCYLWWIFWPSVIVHAIVAIIYFGTPY